MQVDNLWLLHVAYCCSQWVIIVNDCIFVLIFTVREKRKSLFINNVSAGYKLCWTVSLMQLFFFLNEINWKISGYASLLFCMTALFGLDKKNPPTLTPVSVCVCVFVAWQFEAKIQLLFNHLLGRQHSQPAQSQIHHQMVGAWKLCTDGTN